MVEPWSGQELQANEPSVHCLPRSVSGTATDWKTGFPDDEITQCDRHGHPFGLTKVQGVRLRKSCGECYWQRSSCCGSRRA